MGTQFEDPKLDSWPRICGEEAHFEASRRIVSNSGWPNSSDPIPHRLGGGLVQKAVSVVRSRTIEALASAAMGNSVCALRKCDANLEKRNTDEIRSSDSGNCRERGPFASKRMVV